MNIHKFTKINLYILIIILMSSLVLSDWVFPGKTQSRPSVNDDNIGAFDLNFSSETSISFGSDFQPLVIDLDNDGTEEIITSSSDVAKIFFINNDDIITLEDEVALGAAPAVQFSGIDDFNNNGFKELIFITANSIKVIEGDGSTYSIIANATITDVDTPPFCANISSDWGCWFGAAGNVTHFNLTTNATKNFTVNNANVFTTDHGTTISPAGADIDRDGKTELIFVSDFDANNEEGILAFELETNTLDTGFSGDGIIDDITDTGAGGEFGHIFGVGVDNLDNAGDIEVIISLRKMTGASTSSKHRIHTYSGTGTSLLSIASAASGEDDGGGFFVANINTADTDKEICTLWQSTSGSTAPRIDFMCINAIDGTKVNDSFIETGGNTIINAGYMPTTGNLITVNSGFSAHQIITPSYIFDLFQPTGFKAYQYTALNNNSNNNCIPADVNSDSLLDIVCTRSGNTFVSFANVDNVNPILNQSVTFGRNYESPVCVGTSVTFWAAEDVFAPYHYSNDLSTDDERLISTCGLNTTFINGTFHENNPQLQCTFNNVGNFQFRVYLQDEANKNNFSQFWTFQFHVTNGTALETCNFPVSNEIFLGEQTAASAGASDVTDVEDIQEGLEIITQQSDIVKVMVIAIVSILIIMKLALMGVNNPIIYALSIFLELIIFSSIDWLQWGITMLFGFVMIGISILNWVSGRGSE